MAQLTADVSRKFGITEGAHSNEPVAASATIYMGSAVGDNGSGYARQLVAGDPFRGFAFAKADNSAGAAGDIDVELRKNGIVEIAVTGVTGVGDIDDTVYASDGATFTKTSTANTAIGKIVRYITGTTCAVYFEALSVRSI
jgi:hypothetical protein